MAKVIKVVLYRSEHPGRGARPQPHRFRVKSGNGRIIAGGEAYANVAARENTVRMMFDPATEVILVHEDGTEERLR